MHLGCQHRQCAPQDKFLCLELDGAAYVHTPYMWLGYGCCRDSVWVCAKVCIFSSTSRYLTGAVFMATWPVNVTLGMTWHIHIYGSIQNTDQNVPHNKYRRIAVNDWKPVNAGQKHTNGVIIALVPVVFYIRDSLLITTRNINTMPRCYQ